MLGLLIGTLVLTQPKSSKYSAAGAATRLVDAPPSQIGRIEVRDQMGGFVSVGASEFWPGWLVQWGTGDTPAGAWPASESTRSAGARILSTTMLRAGAQADLSNATEVLILSTEGEVLRSLDMGAVPLAGTIPVKVAGNDQWQSIGREIGGFLKADALLMWRSETALPGLDASVVSIALGHNDEVTLRLRRVGKSWSLDYPVSAPADPQAVLTLLENLIGLRSTRFTTEPVGDDMLTATMELSAAGEMGKRRYIMLMDKASGICDVSLSVDVDGKPQQVARAGLQLGTDDSSLFDIDAADFISRTVLDVPASEIESFTVSFADSDQPFEVNKRTPDGWAGKGSGFADNWVSLFTEREADMIQLGPLDIPAFMRVEFKRFGGLDLGVFELTFDTENIYWIGQGDLWRGFDSNIKEIDLGFGFD